MHFREMRMEILTKGLEYPEQPINLSVNTTMACAIHASDAIGSAASRCEDDRTGDSALVKDRQGGLCDSRFGRRRRAQSRGRWRRSCSRLMVTSINPDSIVPVTPILDYLYTHPTSRCSLRLRRGDGTEQNRRRCRLSPPSLWDSIRRRAGRGLGRRWACRASWADGWVIIIRQVNDDDSPDAYGDGQDWSASKEPVKLVVERGEGDSMEMVDITIKPVDSLQTIPPTASIAGEIAINAVGFAYRPLPVVESMVVRPLCLATPSRPPTASNEQFDCSRAIRSSGSSSMAKSPRDLIPEGR